MSKINDGGPVAPAYQNPNTVPGGSAVILPVGGMSLRDFFAAHALAFLAHPKRIGVTFDAEGDAEFAYAVADHMLVQRAKEKS